MLKTIRNFAVLALIAPAPVLVYLGFLQPDGTGVTEKGAVAAFAIAILAGLVLSRLILGVLQFRIGALFTVGSAGLALYALSGH